MLQEVAIYHMAPQDNTFMSFSNTLYIIKHWPQKFQYSVISHVLSYEYFKVVVKSSLPSPNKMLSCSCIVPSILIKLTVANHSITHDQAFRMIRSMSSATQLGTYTTFMPKQKATTLSCMDLVLVWPSDHVSLAVGHGVLMLQMITALMALHKL